MNLATFRLALRLAAFLGVTASLWGYPEFQKFIVVHSGKPVNCAMCHLNGDGPEGNRPGQIGHLSAADLERLGRARAAFDPGATVDNPILNEFGNHIIKSIGKKKFLEIRLAPEQLAPALPGDSDLDHDGIPDIREFLEGTHPVNPNDGNPWLLFQHNFARNLLPIVLTLAATTLGVWGLSHLLQGFAAATRVPKEDETEETAS